MKTELKTATFLIKEISYEQYKEIRDKLIWFYPSLYLISEYMAHLLTARIVFTRTTPPIQSLQEALEFINVDHLFQFVMHLNLDGTLDYIDEQRVKL